MNPDSILKYIECGVCKKHETQDWMAYIKPKDLIDRDYFPEIGDLCTNCVWKELDRLIVGFLIPRTQKNNAFWIKNNIITIAENHKNLLHRVENIIFICGLILNKTND